MQAMLTAFITMNMNNSGIPSTKANPISRTFPPLFTIKISEEEKIAEDLHEIESMQLIVQVIMIMTAMPLASVGNAAAGGSHFLIICSNSFAFLVVSAQVFSVISCICIMVGIVSINLSFLDSSFLPSISPKVFIRSICSSTSVF